MKANQLLFSLLILLFADIAIASPLTQVEKKLVQQIDSNLPKAILLLEKSVNINSDTMNFNGVKKVGELFKTEFDQLGFTNHWIDGSEFNRAGHLVAEYGIAENQNRKLLLIGHLDTVFAADDKFQHFERREDNKVKGPGITDMKGGDVIIIEALRALKQQGMLDKLQIKVVMTGDEEKSGKPLSKSKQALIEAAEWADVALGFEDGDGDIKTAVISRRGASNWTLNVTGKAAHSSQIFSDKVGDGAIFEAARILNAFREKLQNEENLTFSPGLILAGTTQEHQAATNQGSAFGKTNVVAKTALVSGDIRALSPQQLAKAQKIMQKIVSNNLNHTHAILTFAAGYPPMAPSEGNKQLLAFYNQASLDLGYGKVTAVNPRNAGAADISFAANSVSMSLDGLGLMGTGGHTKDETADINSFAKNAHKAALLIYRLSQRTNQ